MIKKIGAVLIKKRTTITMLAILILLTEDIWEKQQMNIFWHLRSSWGMVGLALIAIGIILRSWSAGTIHKSEQLCTTGPYALVRHPLYLGSFFIAFGFCTISADIENFIVITIIILFIYGPKIFYEEKKLAGLFGDDWSKYKKSVPCIIPVKIPQSGKVLNHFSWQQWKINKEYNAVIVSSAVLVMLYLMHIYLGM